MTRTSFHGEIKIGQGGSGSNSSTAITCTAIDTAKYGGATLLLTGSAGSLAITCQTSDDGSTYASDTALDGDTAITLSTKGNGGVDYVGDKRYVKFIITPTSATFSYATLLVEPRRAE